MEWFTRLTAMGKAVVLVVTALVLALVGYSVLGNQSQDQRRQASPASPPPLPAGSPSSAPAGQPPLASEIPPVSAILPVSESVLESQVERASRIVGIIASTTQPYSEKLELIRPEVGSHVVLKQARSSLSEDDVKMDHSPLKKQGKNPPSSSAAPTQTATPESSATQDPVLALPEVEVEEFVSITEYSTELKISSGGVEYYVAQRPTSRGWVVTYIWSDGCDNRTSDCPPSKKEAYYAYG